MMIGPNRSGRMAARIITAQPAWPLTMENDRLGARDVFDGLARHRIGQEADEVAGMSGLEHNTDLAVGLEAADAGTMAGARIDHDERPARRIDDYALRRDDAHETVIDRAFELAPVNHELKAKFEHVRDCLGEMGAVLVAPLTHHVPIQDAALRRVDHVLDGWREGTETSGVGM